MQLKEYDDRILQLMDREKAKTSANDRFEFKEHVFMIDPLCDFHPAQGWNKCSQIGGSDIQVFKTLYMAQYYALNILYTLPNEEFLDKFVPPKVNKIIEYNRDIFPNVTGNNSIKKIPTKKGDRFIYFIGAHNSESAKNKDRSSKAVSFPTDVNIHDEASRSDQDILEQARSRYSNSDYKIRWLMDNPTFPKQGADAVFRKSDQKRWHIQCNHCGKRQYIKWNRLDKVEFVKGTGSTFIDPERHLILCGHCGAPIDDHQRLSGEWVATNPSITDYRGYQMNQLIYVKHNVKELVQLEDNEQYPISQFYNFQLGEPYIGSDINLTSEDIRRNLTGEENDLQGNYMGIDQGKVKWYVIGNEDGIHRVGFTKKWEDIERLMAIYNIQNAVSDALPYTQQPKYLSEKYQGRFYRAFYVKSVETKKLAVLNPGKQKGVVHIQRDEMIDHIVNKILGGNYPLQEKASNLDTFIEHWCNMNRIVETDANGNERFTWLESGADHLAHASVYFEAAKMLKGRRDAHTTTPKKAQTTHLVKSTVELNARGEASIDLDKLIHTALRKRRK